MTWLNVTSDYLCQGLLAPRSTNLSPLLILAVAVVNSPCVTQQHTISVRPWHYTVVFYLFSPKLQEHGTTQKWEVLKHQAKTSCMGVQRIVGKCTKLPFIIGAELMQISHDFSDRSQPVLNTASQNRSQISSSPFIGVFSFSVSFF